MEDKELFELCKQVHEKTGWGDTREVLVVMVKHWIPNSERITIRRNNEVYTAGINYPPLYTTDYILEKLPGALNSPSFNVKYRLSLKKIDNWYFAEYSNHGWFRDMKSVFARKGYDTSDDSLAYAIKPVTDDTPLKALLKLTIALHDAGELK